MAVLKTQQNCSRKFLFGKIKQLCIVFWKKFFNIRRGEVLITIFMFSYI